MSKPRSLSAIAAPIARKALGKRFAALGALLEHWPYIVGAELAERARPERLDFPHGQRRGGVLTVRTAPADALVLQHESPRILDRLNGHFGYCAIERIKLVQAPPGTPKPVARRSPRPAKPAESAAIANALSTVENPALRHHLEGMAEALLKDSAAEPAPPNGRDRSR